MKHSDLAKKVKELRLQKNYSQEDLAEAAQLSLRTIQRIEGGETEPRGDTLKRLAIALDINEQDLVGGGLGQKENDQLEEDNRYLILLQLSAFSFLIFPILGILVPLALWMMKKDKVKHLNESGKQLLNFEISWCLVQFLTIPIFAGVGFSLFKHSYKISNLPTYFFIAALVIGILYLYNIFLIAINTIRTINNNKVRFSPSIKFLR